MNKHYEIPEDEPIAFSHAIDEVFEREDDPYHDNVVEPFLRQYENYQYEAYMANAD